MGQFDACNDASLPQTPLPTAPSFYHLPPETALQTPTLRSSPPIPPILMHFRYASTYGFFFLQRLRSFVEQNHPWLLTIINHDNDFGADVQRYARSQARGATPRRPFRISDEDFWDSVESVVQSYINSVPEPEFEFENEMHYDPDSVLDWHHATEKREKRKKK